MNSTSQLTLPHIEAALTASGLPFEVWPCDAALADTAAFCAHYCVPPENSVNAILVRRKSEVKKVVLCMVLATHWLDFNHTFRKRPGEKKASFALLEDTRTMTGMEIGSVTLIGLYS